MHYVVHNHFPARDDGPRSEFVEAYIKAKEIDPLRYLDGLKKLTFVPDIDDHWNASYSSDGDMITIAGKFHDKTFEDKVQTLLHESGHRGQKTVDKPAFKAFMALKLNKLSFFLAMANQVHQEDYARNGIDPTDMADEVFAESYSRFALGMPMPEPLREFWTRRAK